MKHSKHSETSPEETVELPAGNISFSITPPKVADTIQVCAVTFIGPHIGFKTRLSKLSKMISSILRPLGVVSLTHPTVQWTKVLMEVKSRWSIDVKKRDMIHLKTIVLISSHSILLVTLIPENASKRLSFLIQIHRLDLSNSLWILNVWLRERYKKYMPISLICRKAIRNSLFAEEMPNSLKFFHLRTLRWAGGPNTLTRIGGEIAPSKAERNCRGEICSYWIRWGSYAPENRGCELYLEAYW